MAAKIAYEYRNDTIMSPNYDRFIIFFVDYCSMRPMLTAWGGCETLTLNKIQDGGQNSLR